MLYALLTGPALPEASAKSFFAQMQKNRITLLTTTLRTRPREYKQQLVARFPGFGFHEGIVVATADEAVDRLLG